MKDFFKFVALYAIKIISEFISIFVIALIMSALSYIPVLNTILSIITEGHEQAFLSQASIILSLAICWIAAEKMDAVKPFISVCVVNIVIHLISMILNIKYGDWAWPNFVSIIITGLLIFHAKTKE